MGGKSGDSVTTVITIHISEEGSTDVFIDQMLPMINNTEDQRRKKTLLNSSLKFYFYCPIRD